MPFSSNQFVAVTLASGDGNDRPAFQALIHVGCRPIAVAKSWMVNRASQSARMKSSDFGGGELAKKARLLLKRPPSRRWRPRL